MKSLFCLCFLTEINLFPLLQYLRWVLACRLSIDDVIKVGKMIENTNSRPLKTLIHNFKSHSVFYVQKCAFYKCNIIIICLWRKQEVMTKVRRHARTHAQPITTLLRSGQSWSFLVSPSNRRSKAKPPSPRQQANPQHWSVLVKVAQISKSHKQMLIVLQQMDKTWAPDSAHICLYLCLTCCPSG